MEIDVLLPFHKRNHFLQQAVESIQVQEGVTSRLILIDDCRDSNSKLTFGLRPHDIVVRNTNEHGYGGALRTGSSFLEAPFVALMNSDDYCRPTRLRNQLDALRSSDVSITLIQRVTQNGIPTPALLGELKMTNFDARVLLLGAYGANASWCARSTWWRSNAFFDSSPALDWRIALRSFHQTNVSVVSKKEYFYRRHRSQVTKSPEGRNFIGSVSQEWRFLARKYQLPVLEPSSLELLLSPWECVGKKVNIVDLRKWFEALLLNCESEEVQSNLSDLFLRRLTFSVFCELSSRKRLELIIALKSQFMKLGIDVVNLRLAEYVDPLLKLANRVGYKK